ncbi:MAG: methyltransferase [Patescibacteria group bacterium]|nr:methyltransferase [Patescibacteria group bacterium]
MNKPKEWEQEVRDVFEKIKSHKEPYSVNVNGVEVYIFPDVFSPAYFTDSTWFAETIPEIVGQHSFLEIGTGTGIIALFVALNGGQVSMTDINPSAIENAKYNLEKHGISAKTYLGDMYEPLPKDEKFQFIFWNHPFNRGDNPNEEVLLKSGFDFQYMSLEKYISEAHQHLEADGRLLLGTGGFTFPEIKKIADKFGYKMELLRDIGIPLAENSTIHNEYRIYEFVK